MRNRQKQRALRKAGVRKEEGVAFRNGEQYPEFREANTRPTPHEAVRRIVREKKGGRV